MTGKCIVASTSIGTHQREIIDFGLMRRRDLLGTGFGFGVTSVMAGKVHAQSGRRFKIGFLGAASADGYRPQIAALREGLVEQGFTAENSSLIFRWADDDYDRLAALAAELVQAQVDVIVTHGTPGPIAAKRATTTIPIVFIGGADPVALGLVASLNRPGANVTGIAYFFQELCAKRVELLKETLPNIRRIGVFLNPDNPTSRVALAQMQNAARGVEVDLLPVTLRLRNELAGAFEAARNGRSDAITLIDDGVTNAMPQRIGELALERRVPLASGFAEGVRAGALLSYGVDFPKLFKAMAPIVRRCLIDAQSAAEIPITRSTRFTLGLNLKTASAMSLDIPPSIVARADEVIE